MLAVDMVEGAGYISVEAVDADEAFAIPESRSDIALLFNLPLRFISVGRPSRSFWCPGN
jgi:hypothetical protein